MPDERRQHPYGSAPQRGYPPPPQGSHPPHPYGPSGAPGYYGPPPAVHVHLPPKKRAVWPWIDPSRSQEAAGVIQSPFSPPLFTFG